MTLKLRMVSNSRDGERCQPQHSAQSANSLPFGHLQQLKLTGFPSTRIDVFVNPGAAFPQPGHVIPRQYVVLLQENPHMIAPEEMKINIYMLAH